MTVTVLTGTLYSFLLVLARVGGFVAFLPVPAFRNAPDSIRALLTVALTLTLYPAWPVAPAMEPSLGQLAQWAFCEAGFGLAAGLAVVFLTEGFQVAAQVAGLQAGYGYASTIDPNSEADSSVLQVVTSLATALLVFTTGFDHQFLRVLAASFIRFPAGSWSVSAANVDGIVRLGGSMLVTGLRLAFPVVALLLLVDLALAMVGRVQQQLQLLSLAFPAKMAAALIIIALLAPAFPKIFATDSERSLEILWQSIRP